MKKIKTSIEPDKKELEKEITLRPGSLQEYIGQSAIKTRMQLTIDSAKKRNAPLDHILLFGPPGLGKTTLAFILANEMEQSIKYIAGPSLEKSGDIVSVLTQLGDKDILFIDEIHRMNKTAEEVLYSAMEDCFVNINIGRDGQSKQVKINLPKFTLIGATTKPGMLSTPLRDRFGLVCRMEYYTEEELSQIAARTCSLMDISLGESDLRVVARASRGTPRITNRTIARIRDYAVANDIHKINECDIKEALKIYGIYLNGLSETDFKILEALNARKVANDNNFALGLETLAALTGEDIGTIDSVYEPYLLKEGYIEKTPRGRIITEKGISELLKMQS